MAEAVAFYTDTTVCIGCKACQVACHQWNDLPAGHGPPPDSPLGMRQPNNSFVSSPETGRDQGILSECPPTLRIGSIDAFRSRLPWQAGRSIGRAIATLSDDE